MSNDARILPPGAAGATQLQALREAAGLSRAELADRAGLARRTVYYLEGGARPSRATAALLGAVLGCRPSELRVPQREAAE